MLHMIDGPAVMQFLACRRAPLFLRLVRVPGGAWDALDQFKDAPAPQEAVYAYVLVGPAGSVHVNHGPRGGGCSHLATGKYRYYHPQPDEATMRDNAAWRAWATAEMRRRRNEASPPDGGSP